MRLLNCSESSCVSGGEGLPGRGTFLELTVGIGAIGAGAQVVTAGGGAAVIPATGLVVLPSTSLAVAGTIVPAAPAATIAVGAVPIMTTVGACGLAAAGGFLVGDWIEQQTGWGSGFGNWAGTKLGEAGIWW
jgi:hypothetical protein